MRNGKSTWGRTTQLLSRIGRRLFGYPERLGLNRRDAPYRRVGKISSELHRPVLLNLETSDGSGQACHPDVLFIPGGLGDKNWPYWMVCTPYPYKDNRFENPEIFVSYDGILWSIPDRVRNPLVPSPELAGDYNSDPDLVFHDNQLWLFYRQTLMGREPAKTPETNKIFLRKSSDGVQWSLPVEILSDRTGRQLLSPAVIHDGLRFSMWTVEMDEGALKLIRRTSSNGVNWDILQTGKIIGLDPPRQPWHLDVLSEGGRLSAVLVSCTGLGGSGTRIHYAYSDDTGLTWHANSFLLEQIYEFEANLHYRASLCKLNDRDSEYALWYSASSLTDVFSIAYLRMLRVGNNLIPFGANAVEDKSLTAA